MQSNPDESPTVAKEFPSNSKSYTLLTPYTEQEDDYLISLRKDMHCPFPENVQTIICYTGTDRISSNERHRRLLNFETFRCGAY